MAHKKAGGSSRNGRDSQAKRLGLKAFGGELVNAALRSVGAPDDLRGFFMAAGPSGRVRPRRGSRDACLTSDFSSSPPSS